MQLVPLFLAATLALALPQESPLLGKPLPRLELGRPVQGQAWSQASLRGRVVVLDFFELGSATCFSHSLPAAQKLFERYAEDDRVAVVAIATAYDKEKDPTIADGERIRRELEAAHLTLPVMRDKDEQSVKLCGFKETFGVPTTLVIDADGIVRWHAFNTSTETIAAVEKTVAELLQSFWVSIVPNLPIELDAYAKGDYAKAHAAAQKILADAKAAPALRAAAETIERNLDAGVKRMIEMSARSREQGYPARARARLENAAKLFAGVPAVADANAKLGVLKSDASFTKELAAEKALDDALAALEKPKASPKVSKETVRKSLEALAKNCAATPVAARVAQAIASIQ
jgi:thiol-disulfide isomerase/thioredoxin